MTAELQELQRIPQMDSGFDPLLSGVADDSYLYLLQFFQLFCGLLGVQGSFVAFGKLHEMFGGQLGKAFQQLPDCVTLSDVLIT